MKETYGMSTKIVNLKEYSNKEVGLLVQVILIEVLIIFAIISMFAKEFLDPLYVILGLILLTMAYNNKKIYKRKYMTPIYIIVGIYVLINTLIGYIFK